MDPHNEQTPTMSRRTILQLLAAGVAGSSLLPRLASASEREDTVRRLDHIGLQLYTVRRAMTADLEGTLAAIAAAGITELEFAGYYNKPADWWRAKMKTLGFTSPSTHVGMPKTDAEWAPHFEMSKAMGQKWVIVPSIGREYRGADGFKKLAERLNSGGELAKKAGLRMGYHNHDFEFAALPEGGTGYDVLLKHADPSLVDFELDLYWAVKAGQDPLAMIAAHPKRFVCCHVKDAGPAPELKMMDVGTGTIDFKTILAAGRKAGLKHWYIEHDNPTDDLASIKASAAVLKKL